MNVAIGRGSRQTPSARSSSASSSAKNMDWFWTSYDRYVSAEGLKQTKQRSRLIQLFLDLRCHVSAEELCEYSRQQGVAVGLATVYRTLNLLKDAGLVSQHSFYEGRSVYELIVPEKHHDHLVCVGCQNIVEFHDPYIEKRQEEVAARYGFEMTDHRHELFGYCRVCRHKMH